MFSIGPKLGLAIGIFGTFASSINYSVLHQSGWRLVTIFWICYTIFSLLKLKGTK